MPKAEKVEKVADLKERIGSSQAVLLADFRGLSVNDAMALRALLGEVDTSFKVVKNTLMKRAADEAGMESLGSLLEGPTGVAFVEGDPVAAAKKFPALVLKGGFMEGRLLSSEDAQALARLDSREVMLSKIAGLMKGEMSRAARGFQAHQSKFLSLLEALKGKLEPEAAEEVAEAIVEAVAAVEEAVEEMVADAITEELVAEGTEPEAAAEMAEAIAEEVVTEEMAEAIVAEAIVEAVVEEAAAEAAAEGSVAEEEAAQVEADASEEGKE